VELLWRSLGRKKRVARFSAPVMLDAKNHGVTYALWSLEGFYLRRRSSLPSLCPS